MTDKSTQATAFKAIHNNPGALMIVLDKSQVKSMRAGQAIIL